MHETGSQVACTVSDTCCSFCAQYKICICSPALLSQCWFDGYKLLISLPTFYTVCLVWKQFLAVTVSASHPISQSPRCGVIFKCIFSTSVRSSCQSTKPNPVDVGAFVLQWSSPSSSLSVWFPISQTQCWHQVHVSRHVDNGSFSKLNYSCLKRMENFVTYPRALRCSWQR